MNITTINDKKTLTYNLYFKQPVQAIEGNLKMVFDKTPLYKIQ